MRQANYRLMFAISFTRNLPGFLTSVVQAAIIWSKYHYLCAVPANAPLVWASDTIASLPHKPFSCYHNNL